MKTAIIGITGRLGVRVASEELEKNHEVIGMNRRVERVPVRIKDDRIKTVQGDTDDVESILSFIQGADVVVHATAPTREHPERYVTGIVNTMEAAKQAGVKRVMFIGNALTLKMPDGRTVLETKPMRLNFKKVFDVYGQALEEIKKETELDWVVVIPPVNLFPYGEKTDEYRVGTDKVIGDDVQFEGIEETSKISMEELAKMISDEIQEYKYHQQGVTISY